ncbi:MAG: hypothetical protein LBR23_02530, partial [Spirochaetaceae bacterium]|nr:hypothetical protein [Spirochaetaceae bacterium]
MMCKKNLALLGALLALGALAHSTEFSIQVSQCDRGNGKISDSARLFEDALMEYFFEAGHVVSNFPVTLAAGPEEDSVSQALSDARRGSLDYLASVVLVYDRALQGAG